MKIYDIGKELFSAGVYPGDPVPGRKEYLSMDKGDECNLTSLTMGSHSGTHLDAPKHFFSYGKGVDQIPLEKCMGWCRVVSCGSVVCGADILRMAEDGTEKLLLKGDTLLTPDAAECIAQSSIHLLGVESQTVGMEGTTQNRIHKILLEAEIVILEGLDLTRVPEGRYFLAAQPLKLGGVDGSPVRPVLIAE